MVIDGLQYANWSEKVFRQMREGGVDAVHVTIAYHEMFRETVANIEAWNRRFERFPDLICHAKTGDDVRRAKVEGRTAIVFGAQTPAPIEDDIGLVEILHTLGLRFMQLSYNNQSLLATGCYEAEDPGLTRMGREVIAEMNRVGLVVDMSHSAERSTLEAMEVSRGPSPSPTPIPRSGTRPSATSPTRSCARWRRPAACWAFRFIPTTSRAAATAACGVLRDDRADGGGDGGRTARHRIGPLPGSARQRGGMDARGPLDEAVDYGEGSAGGAGLPAAARLLPRQPGFPASSRGLALRGVRRGERDCYPRRSTG
jgi:hypothetical protein